MMVKIIFEYYNFDEEYSLESAWAQKQGDYYRLDNILFYASNYSLGDIVKVEEVNGELFVRGLIKESGHSTIRIIFFDTIIIKSTEKWLKKTGCLYEESDIPTLISVDVPPSVNYAPIKEILTEGENTGKWSFEESCLAHSTI